MRALAFACLAASMFLPGQARADGHGVTVQNGTNETIRSIQISPSPGSGENRLRSQLPPGASGRIGYSTGCQANVRIGFESGRTEDHPDVDTCSEPRVIAGTAGVAGPTGAPAAGAGSTRTPAVKPVSASAVKLAPAPVVPPWTGRSITKRFGGME